jgi:penicillin-binding protein 1A
MSPLDMASGAQTIANKGLHKEPYFVDYVDRADGTRMYTHDDPGVQVLDEGVALTAISTLKTVITNGTGRRYPLANGRPAAGKTGTQEDNTNSWFVGFTPQLTTSVWVGNPNGYIAMNNVPEFVADGVQKVQGGTYPEKIWKLYMDAALIDAPPEDWPPAPPPARPAARLYLPGADCLGKLVGPDPNATTTTAAPAAGAAGAGSPAGPIEVQLARSVPAQPPPTDPPPPSTSGPPTATTEPASTAPVATAPPAPVVQPVDAGTTIPSDVLDPKAPLPTVDPRAFVVYDCRRGINGAIITNAGEDG